MKKAIKPREKTAIIDSLKAGIVPKIGLEHIQVGRKEEIQQFISDLADIENGCSKTRFIIGDFGSGKTFFLTLAKLIALQKNMVVLSADITTEKFLCSSNGYARSLYSSLMANASTKARQNGNAITTIIEHWIEENFDSNMTNSDVLNRLKPLEKFSSCFDFARVLFQYARAYLDSNDVARNNALKWLRGEYTTKTEARADLGVRTIIDDDNYYDYLRLFAKFVTLAGYSGLLVNIDVLAILARLRSPVRKKNFERILSIINDTLQGETENMMFLFGGTTEFLEDRYKGLYSYGALEGRLADNPFADEKKRDLSNPVIRLDCLSQEDLFVLLNNIQNVFIANEDILPFVSSEQIQQFIGWLMQKLGARAFLNPRDAVKSFIGLLTQLKNYPDSSINEYLKGCSVTISTDPTSIADISEDSDLETIRL